MAQIKWTEPALLDLNEIAEYIALDKLTTSLLLTALMIVIRFTYALVSIGRYSYIQFNPLQFTLLKIILTFTDT